MLENLKLGLIILLTGIVVVFSVLVLLILIIKLYSTAVSNAQNSIEQKKIEKNKVEKTNVENAETKAAGTEQPKSAEAAEQKAESDGSIPGEIIAAIAAAVEVIFGEGAVEVKSVKRAKPAKASRRRSAWKTAGMAENTRAF